MLLTYQHVCWGRGNAGLGLALAEPDEEARAGSAWGRSARITEHEKVLQGLRRVRRLSSNPSILNINKGLQNGLSNTYSVTSPEPLPVYWLATSRKIALPGGGT